MINDFMHTPKSPEMYPYNLNHTKSGGAEHHRFFRFYISLYSFLIERIRIDFNRASLVEKTFADVSPKGST